MHYNPHISTSIYKTTHKSQHFVQSKPGGQSPHWRSLRILIHTFCFVLVHISQYFIFNTFGLYSVKKIIYLPKIGCIYGNKYVVHVNRISTCCYVPFVIYMLIVLIVIMNLIHFFSIVSFILLHPM